MSNFERPSQQPWEPLELNSEQKPQELNQNWKPDDKFEDPYASIPGPPQSIQPPMSIPDAYSGPKTRGGTLGRIIGKIMHWNYCPKHGIFSGDVCDEPSPHE